MQEHYTAKVVDFSPQGGVMWKEQQTQEPGRPGGVQSPAWGLGSKGKGWLLMNEWCKYAGSLV